MKTKFAILLWLGLVWSVPTGAAEAGSSTNPPPAATVAAPESAATNPPPAAVVAAPESAVTNPPPAATVVAPESGATNPPPAPVLSAPAAAETPAPPAALPSVQAPQGVNLASEAAKIADKEPVSEESFNFYDTELIDLAKMFAKLAKISLVWDPSITRGEGPDNKSPVQVLVPSFEVQGVAPRDALELLLGNYSFAMMPQDTKNKVFRVLSRDKIREPVETLIIKMQYSSPTNIVNILSNAFSSLTLAGAKSAQPPQFVADTRGSQLVVLATKKDLEQITNMLVQLDQPTRQVLIEAKLIETSQNPQSVKGIDWSGTLQNQNVAFGNGRTTVADTSITTPGGQSTITLPSGATRPAAAGSSSKSVTETMLGSGSVLGMTANTASGISPGVGFLNADGVSAVLSFLNTDNDTEVVAMPRAVTLDNETATLSVTRAYPQRVTSPGTANVPGSSTLTYTNVGTLLTVTPRITGGTNVAMKVMPEVSNIDGKDNTVIDGKPNQDNIFAFRKMEANVVVPSGYTLVMGGLLNDKKSKSYTKVPVLGDLPLLGMAFRKEDKQKNKQNLLIFITPTILDSADFQKLPGSNFLKTKGKDPSNEPTSAWDTGKPYDWNKKSRGNKK